MQQIYFKQNLKYLTSNTIISQSKLALALGISRQAVYNFIYKEADPRLSTIIKIAEVYKIKPEDLMFKDLEDKYKDKNIIINIK